MILSLSAGTTRRAALLAGLVAASMGGALAQEGTVKMVVPFGPGTTTDTVARVVAEGLSKSLKQTVIVDNRAGAGGSTGTDQVAKAAPDGKTLVSVSKVGGTFLPPKQAVSETVARATTNRRLRRIISSFQACNRAISRGRALPMRRQRTPG